jgi:RNA polymerase sigma factor (sigma-70 family)
MNKDHHLTVVDNLEHLIISEIRKKNDRVLHQLYKTHYPMILNLVITNNGSEPEAKDLYQESIIAFYERVQQKDFVLTCKIKTYIYAICKHKWLKRLAEKKKGPVRLDEVDNFPEQHDEISTVEENERRVEVMTKSLGMLGEPCHTLIQDFYINNLTMEQISEKFGYTNADNAKNQKYKCLQRLKKIFFAGPN